MGRASPVEISILIPAFNEADGIGEQLEAIRTQEYEGSWELIVADNRSTDHTAEVVARYQKRMPNLRLLRADERQGRAYALNRAAREACGRALIFCDANDVAAPGWLAAMAEALATHHAVAGAVDTKTLNQGAPPRPFGYRGVEQPALGFLPYLIGCNTGISREAFDAVGGFDESLPRSQDMDISWRLQLKGYALHYAPTAVMRYRFVRSLRELQRQIYLYAFNYPLFYKRYAAHGMPRSSPRMVLRRYLWLIWHSYYLVRSGPGRKAKWLYEAAYIWGLIRGSLYHRVLYL